MGEQDQQTRQRLLRCAKAEFLSRGFEHASLRRICGAAGVTTGAVYFFFQNKEDLFAQIVQDTSHQLTQLGHELASEELEHPDTGPDCDLRFMAFLYRHREEALLLLEGAKGTRYASFREELYDTMRSAFSLFFHRYGAPDADAELIRILVEMRMKGTLELLKGEYSMEHVLRLTQQTGIYADGGFRSLIAFLQKNSKG